MTKIHELGNPNKEGIPYWIQYIKSRIERNKNFLGIITGPTGSGKSWSAISIGEQLDPNFSEDRIVFSGKDLMKIINDPKLPKRKGNVIIWDEAGVDLSNRNWQSQTNKLLNLLLQTFRHRCFILLFTCPYQDFVDTATRKLIHAEISTVFINQGEKKVILRPLLLQYNANYKKFYTHYLKVNFPGKGVLPLTEWAVKRPSKEIIDKYEEKKTIFTTELNESIEKSL